MTREEAKQVFLSRGYIEVEGGTIYDADKWREACVVITEWLEQEPCEDCISRQAAIIQLSHNKNGYDDCDVIVQKDIETIKDLPPVTPQPKTGRWIKIQKFEKWKCSECGTAFRFTFKEHGYCPNCGAKMVESHEGSDKE